MKITTFPIAGPWSGRLAVLLRPRGGDWLSDDVAAWRKEGIEVVVSALTPDEIDNFQLGEEDAALHASGLEPIAFPIPDRGTPASMEASHGVLRRILELLNKGKHVGIHCRQGIGRSGMIAAMVLVLAGVGTSQAWKRIELARGCPVPETPEQKSWVERFARSELAQTVGD